MKFTTSLKTLALSAALTGALTVSGFAQEAVTLKVSHFLPPNHTFHKAMVAWGETLDKESGGKLKLEIFPAGQLGGGPNRQFDAARNGISDIAISLHGATPGRYATTELASLPFAAPAGSNASQVRSRRLTELAPDYLAEEHAGLKILWMAVTPPLMFHSKGPITKLDDFKGLKIRYAGAQFKAIVDSLGAVPLAVPPLRERPEDIVPLAEHFAARFGRQFGLPDLRLTPRLLRRLEADPWPGNVRALEHTLESMIALADGPILDVDPDDDGPPDASLDLRARVAAFEKRLIGDALARCGGNQSETARQLGVSRVTLLDKLARYGLR